MEQLDRIVHVINDYVWSKPDLLPLMVVVLLSYGIFITLRLGFVQLRRFGHGVKVITGYYDNPDDTGDINHFQALSTALSATVGIGNIAGVAIAIHYGGPGALFWMWVTAFFGMAIKFSECTLSLKFRKKNPNGTVSGGPMYYIERGLGANWKWLAVAFAIFAVICSMFTGNAIQANTVADTMQSAFNFPKVLTGIVVAGIIFVVIIGGIKRIGRVTARLTPFMAVIYVLAGLFILLINYDQVIPAFGTIFSYAFNPQAGALGVGSGAFMLTLVWGIKRGLFSNEAGQGSAAIAHAAAKTEEPAREGVVASLGPFIDTLVVCTITALVIITTGVWEQKHPEQLKLNSVGINYTFDETSQQQNTLIVENGVIQNGEIIRNDFPIDTLYVNSAQTETFSGEIEVGDQIQAYNLKKEEVDIIYGNIIENGAPLTAKGFEAGLAPLIPGGQHIVNLAVLLFAISTTISWSYYGDRSIQYLLGDKSIIYYKYFYVVLNFIGATLPLATVWMIGDIALGLMTFPNIIALFALSGTVYTAAQKYFKKMDRIEAEMED